ncbi:MAG: DNA mismatch repair endonuclease MutL [Thermodesulfobacteriota bacterium]
MESRTRIRILPPQVAAQIAAGEVITRPWAVVKELVENALDAGAKTITVEVEEGGRGRIRVVDDGTGMSPEEARLSLERHATSKLRVETDLLHISTLGFRGEALPSIAAVSRLEMITCPPGQAGGYRLVALAGNIEESSPWSAPFGTQINVSQLFFNTPARRKFLRSRQAEQAYLVESLRHLALGYPEVHFLLKTPGRTLLAAPATQSLKERVAAIMGPEVAGHLLPFSLDGGPVRLAGLLSAPDFSLASNRFQVLLVNRRVVQDRLLGGALKEAYQGLLPKGRHPAVVVHLDLPPEMVDVNVHPAKTEVRFQESGRIFALLLSALRQGLVVQGEETRYTVTWSPASLSRAQEAGAPAPATFSGFRPAPRPRPEPPPFPSSEPGPVPPPPLTSVSWRFQDLLIIGQLAATYILAQGPEGLVLIDQHAAHERVLYEMLQDAAAPARQPLLFPRVVEVPPAQAGWLQENLEHLARVGLELEPFGGASFLITAAPPSLAQADLEAAVLETVEALAPLKSASQPQTVLEQARLYLSCRGAIKAGQELKREEMEALLKQLDELQVSSHCPHGRPLWRLIPYSQIRQSFLRP